MNAQRLNFEEDYILENEVTLLRPLRASDFEEMLKYAIAEPKLWTYSLLSADGKENMEKYLQAALEAKSAKTSYPFAVFDKRKNRFAGSTRFYDFSQRHLSTQLGYTWYGKEFWGRGLNKNCKYLMLEFAFEKLGLERVEFRADNKNARSIAAMKSMGCTVEGVLRNNCASYSGRRDSIVLSILKQEWFERVKGTLYQKC
ncbi:MAG: GNAT family N-acetyltransferase [Bacteroidota bacterium]